MGVFKNDVGRPTNETIKKRRILKAILALLVAGALFIGGYYVNDFINKYDVNKEEKENVMSKKEAEKLISIVSQVNINSEKFGYFYKQDRNIDNLDNDVILISAISKLITDDKRTFTKNEVNQSVKKIFGDIKYKDESVSSYCYEFNYDASKELYTDNSGCSGDGPYIYSEIINVETSSDKLTIIDKIAVSDFNYDSGILTLYKDLNRSIVIKENYDLDEGIKEYLDILDSYKWTFVKNSEGNYIFESVEKISKEITENTNSKELDINSEEVMDLFNIYNKFNDYMHLNFKYTPGFTYFYNQDKVYMKDIDESLKFAIIYDEYFNDKYDKQGHLDEETIVYMSDLNKLSNELFSTNIDIKKVIDKDNYINVFGCTQLKYNEKEQSIIVVQDGCGDCIVAEFDTKIISAVKSKDKIEIVNKVMFLYGGCDEPMEFKLFKSATNNYNNRYGFVDEIADLTNKNISIKDIKIDDYLDKLDSFKWTFVKNSEGNYIFESVEKIK